MPPDSPNEPTPKDGARRPIQWDALAAIIASLVGFLALLVAGYTAYVERYTAEIQEKQVQAQVWPWLAAGNNDNESSIEVTNKGVGPAIIRSAQVFVDGKPQPDWQHVLMALGIHRMDIRRRRSTRTCSRPVRKSRWSSSRTRTNTTDSGLPRSST